MLHSLAYLLIFVENYKALSVQKATYTKHCKQELLMGWHTI